MKWTVAMLIGSTSCGTCNDAYKRAFQLDATHHVEYARELRACQPDSGGNYSGECMMSWAMPLAGAQCFSEEGDKRSTSDAKSRSCKCAKPVSVDDRQVACTEWLKNGN